MCWKVRAGVATFNKSRSIVAHYHFSALGIHFSLGKNETRQGRRRLLNLFPSLTVTVTVVIRLNWVY